MCGIVGYAGNHQAAPVLLDGLSKLEYRGYDSAGIALLDKNGQISFKKTVGRIENLENEIKESLNMNVFKLAKYYQKNAQNPKAYHNRNEHTPL